MKIHISKYSSCHQLEKSFYSIKKRDLKIRLAFESNVGNESFDNKESVLTFALTRIGDRH